MLEAVAAEVVIRKEQGFSSESWINNHFHDASEAILVSYI